MMMGHDSTNVLIGGKTSNSTRSSSDESGGDGASALNPSGTDTLDPIQGDFFRGVASGAASLDDDAFDKIEMDFDAIMANDLELDPLGKKTGNSDANSDVLFASDDKGIMSPDHSVLMNKAIMSLGLSPDGGSKKMGISSKLGDIGDEIEGFVLDDDDKNTNTNTSVPVVSSHGSISMNSLVISGSSKSSLTAAGLHNQQAPALMDGSDSSINQVFKLLPSGNSGGSNNSQSSIDKLLANSENSMDKLLSMDILDFDLDGNNNDNKGDGNDPQTSQTNLSMADLESMGGINSLSSLPSVAVGNITPTGSFLSNGASGAGTTGNHAAQVSISTENNQAPAPASSQTQKQQQHALMMQRQQQLFLKQQQQQQQHLQQQLQKQQQQQQQNNANVSSISSIVNNHLSQLPQASQLNQMAASNLEQEKMQLIRRLQEIERAGMNGGQQQQQQLLFHQQQLLLQQQQKQQQQLQQRGLVVTNQPMKGNPQQLQGQQQQQHQTTPFSMNVQLQQPSGMAQADMLSQSSMAVAPSPTPFSGTALNDSNTATSEALRKQLQQSSSMFAANNSVINNANSPMNSSNVSSVMGSSVKETPLQSFLRNKRSSGGSSSGTPSMASQGQQRQTTSSAMVADNVSDTKNTGSGKSTFSSILDAKPLDFSSVSNNPFLRKQMMVNMDRSVNSRGNTMRGRGRSSGLSSSIRQSMMQQIAPGRQSEAESSDFYQSAGIISRHASADHLMVPSRRGSIGAGAAKAQNRRFTLSRSNSSFGNLKKSKSNSKMRDLHKANSNRSLSSNDSAGSLLPVKRGNGVGGRGGFGAKHRLGSSGSIHLGSRRTQSTPYMIQGRSGSAAEAQQLRLQQQHEGSKQNDGWP